MWLKLRINKQNVDIFDNFVKINCPHNSKFNGYYFFYSQKLINFIDSSIELLYKDDFIFRLKKKGNGRYNKNKVVEEIEIDANTIEEIFDCMQTKDSSYLIIKEPHKIDKNIEILEELKNDK